MSAGPLPLQSGAQDELSGGVVPVPTHPDRKRAVASAPLQQSGISKLTPYYSADGITVYNARWEDVIDQRLAGVVSLIHADPPYGQRLRTADHAARRDVGPGGGRKEVRRNGVVVARPKCKDYPSIAGDDRPFEPGPLLALRRPLVAWGAQRYAASLPVSPSWLWWAKLGDDATPPDDNGDGEMAWTNLGGPPREFRLLWKGFKRGSETCSAHLHPTQKPIALSMWVFQRAKLKRGDLVFVPFLGSGPDLPAARAMGLRVIACDVEEWCCRTAVARLGAAPHPEPVEKLGALFDRVKP